MQAQQMIMILLRMLVIVSTPPYQATHYSSACLLSRCFQEDLHQLIHYCAHCTFQRNHMRLQVWPLT